MKTQITLSNITEEMNNIKTMQAKSIAQKSEIDNAEAYANSILRFVHRKEVYMECCGGMYYA
jgi:hypothetical protein